MVEADRGRRPSARGQGTTSRVAKRSPMTLGHSGGSVLTGRHPGIKTKAPVDLVRNQGCEVVSLLRRSVDASNSASGELRTQLPVNGLDERVEVRAMPTGLGRHDE